MPLESPYPMLSFDNALNLIFEHAGKGTLPTQAVGIGDSIGLVLAQDVHAPRNLPPFPASMKDGYAVRATDANPIRTLLSPTLDAGVDINTTIVGPGQAVYIATGAPLPPGADAVVMVEQAEVTPDGKQVEILNRDVQPGLDVRPVGSDIQEGTLVLTKGQSLSAADIGLLATCGVGNVLVVRRPTLAILSTGDELVEASKNEISPEKIRDSNRPMLISMLQPFCEEVVDLGIVHDSEDDIRGLFTSVLMQQKVHVLVTSGGVSMGRKDYVKPILENLGTVHFGRVLMKPGKPLTFATIQYNDHTMFVFGLPGNPVSSGVTATIALIPALRTLAGCDERSRNWPQVDVYMDKDVKLDRIRREYHRVAVTWDKSQKRYKAFSTGNQLSSRLLSLHGANALLVLPIGSDAHPVIPAGHPIPALLICSSPY